MNQTEITEVQAHINLISSIDAISRLAGEIQTHTERRLKTADTPEARLREFAFVEVIISELVDAKIALGISLKRDWRKEARTDG